MSFISLEETLVDGEGDFLELPLDRRAFKIFLIIVVLTVFLVFAQMVNIGILGHSYYVERAFANISNFRLVKSERGVITDRFGDLLVGNERAMSVILVPRGLPDSSIERGEVFDKVSGIFDLDRGEIEVEVGKKEGYFYDSILLANNLSRDELVEVVNLSLPGVKVEEGFRRVHKEPFLFSHVLGYMGLVNDGDLKVYKNLSVSDEIGRMGLEQYYDGYLRGENGVELLFRDSLGSVVGAREIEFPQQGSSLEVSIDGEFQSYFYGRLQEALEGLEREIGIGLAMNPQNGEVLALFGVPSFDSSNVADYLEDRNLPLFNRAVSGLYSPGSTIKPLVAVGALTEGVIGPDGLIYSAGYIEVPNPYNPSRPTVFKDWKAHGWVDVRSAIARSSNVYFYEVGGGFNKRKGLGIRGLKAWWQRFNLDRETGIDLPGEKAGFLPDPEWREETQERSWLLGDTYNVSIGQGDILITPIELLTYISAIANGGKIYRPMLVRKIYGIDGTVLGESEPIVVKDLGDDIGEFLPEVQRGMIDAVDKTYGTSYMLSDLPMGVAAKTGTSQVASEKKLNAFFTGYAPVGEGDLPSEPSIAILILIEDAKEGSLNVVPVARDVFRWYYENRLKEGNQ